MVTTNPIICPIPPPHGADTPFTPCPLEELTPLLRHLWAGDPVGDVTAFPRGTMTPDGRLDLCKQSIGVDGCRDVTSALRCNPHVKCLLLGTDGIGDTGAGVVADLLERSELLTTVYLGCNWIGGEGAARLADAVSENRAVTGLWLKRNPLRDEGAFALAAMLRRNTTLRVLDLVNTGFGADGLTAILSTLTEAGTGAGVERLYLGGNGLGPGSAPLLGDLLRHNTCLKALQLNVNALGDTGASVLAEGLRGNTTLRELGLASNGLGTDGLCAVLGAAMSHPALRSVDLSYARSTRALRGTANAFGDRESRLALRAFAVANPRCAVNIRGSGIPSHYNALFADGAAPPVPEEVARIRSVYR